MEIFSMVLSLLSGVALFLFGMSLMGDGLKQVAGNKLEAFLYKMTNTPLKGVALGTGVTSVIQSSSATTVMVIGFVNSGMMKLKQAIGINDKFLLLRDLFGGDTERYERTIDRLNEFDDLDDCIIYISENYDWNPSSDGVRFLMELLERKLS